MVPKTVVSSDSVTAFKSRLKTFLFSWAFSLPFLSLQVNKTIFCQNFQNLLDFNRFIERITGRSFFFETVFVYRSKHSDLVSAGVSYRSVDSGVFHRACCSTA